MSLPADLGDRLASGLGLVLIGGVDDRTRSTTAMSICSALCHTRTGHLVTIEREIRWWLPHGNCLVTQRELGADIADGERPMLTAIDRAMRLPADILLVCELSEAPAPDRLLAAAQSNALVLVTLPGVKPSHLIDWLGRIVGPDHIETTRSRVANTLRTLVIGGAGVPEVLEITDEMRMRIRLGEPEALDDVLSE